MDSVNVEEGGFSVPIDDDGGVPNSIYRRLSDVDDL